MMDAASPLVSMVVPSWQKGQYLRRTLESLLRQDYPNIEIIVRDNLSTDDTARVLEEYEGRLGRIIRERDQGQADALKRGYDEASGSILGWLNADDMLMPDAISKVVRAFQSPRRPDLVYGHCAFLDERSQFVRYFHEIQPFSISELCTYADYLAQPSTFFSRAIYDAIGGIDPHLHFVMDWDLWCRFARAGARFEFLDDVLSGARLYDDTKTAAGGSPRLREMARVNLRHASPPVPLAAATHFYAENIQSHIGLLHRPLRWAWRRLTGRVGFSPTVVFGLRADAGFAADRFTLKFPFFERVAGARMTLTATNGATERISPEATLNGVGPTERNDRSRGHIDLLWQFDDPVDAAAVVVEATTGGRATDWRLQSFHVNASVGS